MSEPEVADPVSIDAVAAAFAAWVSKHKRGSDIAWQEDICFARAAAEAGFLRTPEDRQALQVLDRLNEQIGEMEDIQRSGPVGLTEVGRAGLMAAYYIRDGEWRLPDARRAAGGTVPTDPPEAQP